MIIKQIIMISIKRGSLILPPILIGVGFGVPEIMNSNIYFVCALFTCLSILLWNVPYIIFILHTTPVYYEDLLLISDNTTEHITRLQNIFNFLNGLMIVIFVTVVSDYIMLQMHVDRMKIVEIIGLMGGLGTVYIRTQAVIGKALLTCLFFTKKKEVEPITDEGIQMVNVHTSIINTDSESIISDARSVDTIIMNDLWKGKRYSPTNHADPYFVPSPTCPAIRQIVSPNYRNPVGTNN